MTNKTCMQTTGLQHKNLPLNIEVKLDHNMEVFCLQLPKLELRQKRATLKAKVAALRGKLATEEEEAEFYVEKRCRETLRQAEEKWQEAKFEAEQKGQNLQ